MEVFVRGLRGDYRGFPGARANKDAFRVIQPTFFYFLNPRPILGEPSLIFIHAIPTAFRVLRKRIYRKYVTLLESTIAGSWWVFSLWRAHIYNIIKHKIFNIPSLLTQLNNRPTHHIDPNCQIPFSWNNIHTRPKFDLHYLL